MKDGEETMITDRARRRSVAMREPGPAGNAVGSKTRAPWDGRAQGGHEEMWNNEEETAAPSGLWVLWDEAEERGDRDVAALMWEAMYGRGPGR